MKKNVLSLIPWDVTTSVQETDNDGNLQIVQKSQAYPIKDNLGAMLRAGGLFTTVEDTVEAILLGKTIQSNKEDSVNLDERELTLLKSCLDKHLEAATKGQSMFGGPQHEELVLRIYELWKNKDKE